MFSFLKRSFRLPILQTAVMGGFLLLLFGLFQAQIIRGGYYRKASEQNRIRLIRIEAPRGNIYDRNGDLLATNRPAYNVYAIPEDFDPKDIPALSHLLKLPESKIRNRLSQARFTSFSPILLKQDVSKEVAMRIEELRPELGGIFIQIGCMRYYPQREAGAHIVGYIGKISKDEFARLDPSIYHFDSWIGRSGIERVFDAHLRGEDGGRQLEVNARGVPIRLLGEKDPVPGKDLHLTIDAKLEASLRPLIPNHNAAILMMDLKTGGILSAVSMPGFDPNIFVSPGHGPERLNVIGSKSRPLLNRTFNGLYPPGSIFKLVTAMAALETGVITPHTTFNCPGYFQFNGNSRKFKCWNHEGHGRVDLYTAIERSCNVYFYNVGRLVGEKRLAEYARKIGFGSSIPLELPTAGGLVPDAEWKNSIHHDKWYPGDTITFAIGQSYLLVSPLQILRLVAAIATDGKIMEPTLIADPKKNRDANHKMSIQPNTFKTLRQGMLQVVASDHGTGQLARIGFAKLAAKTGTAQAPPGESHAWFGGFFPYEDPSIGFVVFVERGKSGGFTAAQIAKKAAYIWNDLYGAKVS